MKDRSSAKPLSPRNKKNAVIPAKAGIQALEIVIVSI
jgi:hypothetical protein